MSSRIALSSTPRHATSPRPTFRLRLIALTATAVIVPWALLASPAFAAGPVGPGDLTSCEGTGAEHEVVDNCDHPDPTPEPTPEPCEQPEPAADVPLTSLSVPSDDGSELDLTASVDEGCDDDPSGGDVTFTG
jgi:hypothetical protein